MDKIDFTAVLKEKRDLIWPIIEKFLQEPIHIPDGQYKKDYSEVINSHKKMVSEYPNRKGKYVRPSLVTLTAEAFGVQTEKTLQTAAAMQTSEDWLLIHDDWEDHSLERRGNPTLHLLFSPELAVNAGDLLHTIMWRIIVATRTELGVDLMLEIFGEFQQILRRTILGQSAEIEWSQNGKELSDDDWFFIADGKTSYYTIAGPMRLGAIIAGATKEQLKQLLEFGMLLGRAFQIRDDYLDITSDFAGLKKQQGNDIYENKKTLMLGHLLRTASGKDKNDLELILKKSREQKTAQEINFVIEKMKQYGSLDYSQKIANDLAKQAEKFFEEKLVFLSAEPARSQLYAGIKFMVERDH